MALSHNAFIRGFNSICQQAPRVQDAGSAADKKGFVDYCIAWHDCVEKHHHYEETEFFPNLNKAAGKTGLMGSALAENGIPIYALPSRPSAEKTLFRFP